MGLQLIFAVETNKTCKSDWIYIKDTISRFYTIDQAIDGIYGWKVKLYQKAKRS